MINLRFNFLILNIHMFSIIFIIIFLFYLLIKKYSSVGLVLIIKSMIRYNKISEDNEACEILFVEHIVKYFNLISPSFFQHEKDIVLIFYLVLVNKVFSHNFT